MGTCVGSVELREVTCDVPSDEGDIASWGDCQR